jgi:hypothetical protein
MTHRLLIAVVALGLAGCGRGAAPEQLDLSIAGRAVLKVRGGAESLALLEEKLTSLRESGPDRRLTILDHSAGVAGGYSAPSGWALIDFALHPSGQITAVLATTREVKLVRLDRFGSPIDELPLIDAQAPSDPFFDAGGVRDDGSLLPVFTRDAVRVAPIGESVAVALHTGRNAAVAYRFDYASGFTRAFRTLVEPGLSMFGVGITSGSFDTFGQLNNHFELQLDASDDGSVAIAVVGRPFLAPVFAAHAAWFGEPIPVTTGILVTRLAPDGSRLGATAVDTSQSSELHALRTHGEQIVVAGRVFSEKRPDGAGWDAWAAQIDRQSGLLRNYRVVDLDRGEVLFDVAPLDGGRLLLAGAAGYTQNPDGASISETAAPLLGVLEIDGTVRRIAFDAGPRQNQLRSLDGSGDRWFIGGMVNGPGTHSGDADPSLITADGFLREIPAPGR